VVLELRLLRLLWTPNSAGAVSSEKAIRRGTPPEFWKNTGANSSSENSVPDRNHGLKRTHLGAIFKKLSVNTTFKLKINLIRNNLNCSSIQSNPQ
jgi:hypothetical protein